MEQTQASTRQSIPLAIQSAARIVNLCIEATEAQAFIALDELFLTIARRAHAELRKNGNPLRLLRAVDAFALIHDKHVYTREFARGHFGAVEAWVDPAATDPESRVIRALLSAIEGKHDVRPLLDAFGDIVSVQDIDNDMQCFLELAHHFLFVDDSQHGEAAS